MNLRICILDIYHSGPASTLVDNSKDKELPFNISIRYRMESGNCIFIIQLISEHSTLNLCHSALRH